MLTKREILDRHTEVTAMIKFFCGNNGQRYSFIMSHNLTMEEFISNVWFRILSTIGDDAELPNKLSTIVITACRWELSAMINRPKQDLLDYPDRRAEFVASSVADYVDDSTEQYESLCDLLWRLRRSVPDRLYRILWRFGGLDGCEHTLASIGKIEGITRERVRQLVVTVAERLNPPPGKTYQKIREAAWRERLGKSEAGRILLAEFDQHCPLGDTV